ncbi:hypothetical protein ACR9O1_004199 [Salmonella enterica]|nr:hypothetical protein [Salmonella enterica subsp. enterica serovar Reading]EEC1011130.1 hypothetical protein [Salmonella enterica subsp. enterica]EEF5018645.1 hypothetical protein [Salmonella enterica]EJN1848432.1 hypothetical protein [Salmonella enterica]
MMKVLLLLVMVFLLGCGVFGLTAREAVAFTVVGVGIPLIIASFIGLSILAVITTVIMIGSAGVAVHMIVAQLIAIGAWQVVFSLSDSMKSVAIGGINIYESGGVMLFGMSLLTCLYVVVMVLDERSQ